jgi:hypothetical protein
MSTTQEAYEREALEEEKGNEPYRSDGSSPENNDEDGTLNDIMIDRKTVTVNDLLQFGGQNAVACGNITMPSKLYGAQANIQSFIESKMVDEWNITKLWTAWLKQVDLKTVINKEEIRSLVSAELEPQMETVDKNGLLQISFSSANDIFSDHDGKKTKRTTFSTSMTGCFFICLLVLMNSEIQRIEI